METYTVQTRIASEWTRQTSSPLDHLVLGYSPTREEDHPSRFIWFYRPGKSVVSYGTGHIFSYAYASKYRSNNHYYFLIVW